MDRKLALWIGLPFVGVAWSLIAVVALVPGLVNSRLLMLLLLALSAAGILTLLLRIAVRDRANSSLPDTLYPIAGILVALGVGFHQEVGAFARGVFDYVMPGDPALDGMRFARADDGQFHVRLLVDGSGVDFMVDPDAPFNVLMPGVPRQVGINPSSLIYRREAGGEYAADVMLPKALLGAAAVENLPFKVFATNGPYNVLGKPFFERLTSWRVGGDTLILVQ